MKKPTYVEGVVVAVIFSVVATGLLVALDWLVPAGALLRMLVSVSAVAYVMYLFTRSEERNGRITTITIMLIASALSWITGLSALSYLSVHLGLIWLVRSLYFYSSVLSAVTDLGLTVFGFAAGIAAYLHTSSVFLGLWCFFLVQAMFTWIPSSLKRNDEADNQAEKYDRFQHAQRVAEQALRKMAAQS